MARQIKTKARAEFGDFQTPFTLALEVTELLSSLGVEPQTVLEPSCGHGTFLSAAAESFPSAESLIGVEINPQYVQLATSNLAHVNQARVHILQGDFFSFDWASVLQKGKKPWLILGNPPWVTNSSLSTLESTNVPAKRNYQGRAGIEAVTGKSNFDISEWMLLRYVEWLKDAGTIAVLSKTSVARKVLLQAWKKCSVSSSKIYKIDAMASFGAAVDACLLIATLGPSPAGPQICEVFASLSAKAPAESFSMINGHLVANASVGSRFEALWGPETNYIWRSGIKHDCSRVMELFRDHERCVNGLGERVEIESDFVYPMLKGSDIGNGRTTPRAAMIVTQRSVGQETSEIARLAPNTWEYLQRHRSLLDRRGSVIYRNKPRFSIFGVGPYTFAPWKVAVSSFYKKLLFVAVGPVEGRTIVFDDTVYFLPCRSEREAIFLTELLHSEPAADFLGSMIHWSDKRPLTIEILKRLSLRRLGRILGRESEYNLFVQGTQADRGAQIMMFSHDHLAERLSERVPAL